jgi:DNA-binding transcriptional regulator YiaG
MGGMVVSCKPVLMHSCLRAAREAGPLDCRCERHVTKSRAKDLVREGSAVFRTFPGGRVNELEIALLRRKPLPPARTIDEAAILGAYVLKSKYEQQRIDVYKEEGSMSERAKLRRRAALTQAQLARLTGIPAPYICFWERGEKELKPEQVERIATVLNEHLGKTPYFDGPAELTRVLMPIALAPGVAA